jgi:hypothetical protein
MRDETLYGGALILSALGMLATRAFHLTGHQLLASDAAIEHIGLVNKVVHGIALGSVCYRSLASWACPENWVCNDWM